MKWLAGLVLVVGAGVGVVMAGGLDEASQSAGDWLVRGIRAASELAPVTPPDRPAPSPSPAPKAEAVKSPAATAAAPAPVAPPARIERRLDQAPQEQVTDEDRDRLAGLIDQGLKN